MSKTWRIIITSMFGLIIIAIGTVFWLKNPDSHILPIIFTVVGLALTFIFGLLSLPSASATTSPMRELPKLIVRADRGFVGQVYLLDSELYARLFAREFHPNTRIQYISEQNVDGHPLYGAVFRDLVPEQQYAFWTVGTSPIHVTLSHGETKTIELQINRGVRHE